MHTSEVLNDIHMKSAKNGTISPSKSTEDGMDPLIIYNILSFVRLLLKMVSLMHLQTQG